MEGAACCPNPSALREKNGGRGNWQSDMGGKILLRQKVLALDNSSILDIPEPINFQWCMYPYSFPVFKPCYSTSPNVHGQQVLPLLHRRKETVELESETFYGRLLFSVTMLKTHRLLRFSGTVWTSNGFKSNEGEKQINIYIILM